VLIADEPTKGLDADLRDSVAQALLAEAAKGNAVLAITHDAAFARALGGELIVMREADIVERGPTLATLDAPRHPYTRALVEADPERWPRATRAGTGPSAVAVEGLAARRGGRTLFAGLDFAVAGGEIVAVSGPSGCGKTTLGDVALGLLAPAAGRVARRSGVARSRFQKLYQDPVASFAPRATLRRSLADVATLFGRDLAGAEAELAWLRVAPDVLDRRPDAVSGGELQRVALARALLADPIFLFADEATSRLDPPAQRATMELLRAAAAERNLALMIVTHDAALAEAMATRAPIRLG
jgi:peptide/nickel transport system ATP-binding protein